MANAGRILIMPKGDYDTNTQYEILDLVHHNGTSWLAKKDVSGIEPSAESGEYWQNMFGFDINVINEINKNLGTTDISTIGDGTVTKGLIVLNEAIAEKAKASEFASHVANKANPHGVTKAQVGLGSVDNTADNVKKVLSASKLTTARNIALTGDVTGSVDFDGSGNVSIKTTLVGLTAEFDGTTLTIIKA